jgi:autotransporter translocation and assembly factor TamB
MKRHIKKILAILLSLLGLVTLFLVLTVVFIQTGPGQRFLEKSLNNALIRDDGRVSLTGISGRIPFNLEVETISIQDGQGQWLSISGAKLKWSFSKLFSREIYIHELGANSVDLARLPDVKSKDEEITSPPRDIKWSWPLPALTVEQLYLTSIHISDQVLDDNYQLSLQGTLFADDQGFSLASLEINRLDKPTSMVSLRAGLTKDPYYLDLDLWIFDSGVLESFIEMEHWPSEVSLALKGAGPLNAWQGELHLDGQNFFSAVLNLEVEQDKFYFLQAEGNVYVSPLLLPKQGFDYTQDPFSLDLRAGMDHSRRVVLDKLNIYSPRLGLKARALFEPAEMSASGSLSLDLSDINPLLMDSGFKSQGPLNIQVDFDGPFNTLSAKSNVHMGAVSGRGLSLKQTGLAADFEFRPSSDKLYAVSGDIELAGLGIRQYAILPEDFKLIFDIDHSSENTLNLKKFNLQARDLRADLTGSMDLGSMQFAGDLRANAQGAQKLIPGLPRDPFFKTDMDVRIKGGGAIRKGDYFADLNISMPEFQAQDPRLRALAGDRLELSGSLGFDQQLTLQVSNARLDAKELNFTGSGNMDFKNKDMDFSGTLVMESLTGLGDVMGLDISGEVNVDLAAYGQIVKPDLMALVQVMDFRYENVDPTNLEARVQASIMDKFPSGNLEVFISQADKRFDLLTDFALTENNFEIIGFSAWGQGMEISAELDFALKEKLISGEVLANIADLSQLGDFFDLDISGAFESKISLFPDRTDQNLSFSLSGDDLGFNELFISKVTGSGRMENLFAKGPLRSDVAMYGIKAPQVGIDHFTADVQGTLDNIKFSSTIAGNILHPLDLTIKGNYVAEESTHLVELMELKGIFAHEHFHMDSSSVLAHSRVETSLTPFNLVFGSGILSAQGNLTQETVKASINLKGLNLHNIPVNHFDQFAGLLDLDLQLTGSPDKPLLNAAINIDGLAPAAPHLEIPHALNLIVQASLDSGRAAIESSLLENQTSLASFDLNLPMEFTIYPFNFALPDPVPLSGELRTNLELGTLAMLVLPPDQLLSGTFNSRLTLSGTLSKPSLQGTIAVENAVYENLDAGLYITDLQISALAEQTRINISEIKGSDGLNGRISGSGFFDFDPSGDMPWSLGMDINDMRLINHKLAEVYVDNGDLEVSGDKSQAAVSGKINFQSVNASLPDQSPPGVVDLKVTEINDVHEQEVAYEPLPRTEYPVQLDLELMFPARVFVRGRGLDSEWAGNLMVTGEAARPSVRGSLSIVRGRLELLDRRFNLSRESIINLDGTFPPDPFVDIKADYRHRDMTINVRVYGPAVQPEIELSSEPPMPQDEILAWVLFGRDLSSITPFQAITLVNAARALATGQTGPDMTGRIRDFIGVDDIDITRDPEEGYTQFGLGKYVHEKVYIEVKKGTAPGTDSVSVEVELTPRISLESSVESDSESGVGLFWKYDY